MKVESLRLRYGIIALVAVISLGTFGYWFIERWSFLDALYMTVITIFTVGYGEVNPLSDSGKVFSILIIVLGVGTAFYLAGSLMEALIESSLGGGRKMEEKVARLSGHYLVAGFGRMGAVVCEQLYGAGVPFVVIERTGETTEEISGLGYLWVHGDATDEAVLQKAGVSRARGLVSVLPSDADNVFVALTARGMNPDLYIVARCGSETTEATLTRAGANRVINPYLTTGRYLSQLLLKPAVLDFVEIVTQSGSMDLSVEALPLGGGSPLAGKALKDSPIRREHNIIIVAIKRSDGRMVFNPSSEEVPGVGDVLIAIGRPESLKQLATSAGIDETRPARLM
jgi:voltage-gated potassium channel